MNARRLLLIAALAAATPSLATAQEDTVALGGRTVVVWKPTTSGRHPVIIYSHGLGGCPTGSRFLTQGLADHGYLVIAPFHRDAGCRAKKKVAARPAVPFDQPNRWSDLTYADRTTDVRAIVGALPTSGLAATADMNALAVAGHSLGGYTALGLGGAWTLTRMPEVRAVLALAPYAEPFLAHGTMSELSIPVMFQAGALDRSITAAVRRPGGAFDAARGPKYLVEFSGARHLSWGNKPNPSHGAMLAYAVAFFDRYLRSGVSDTAVLRNKLAGVAELRGEGDPR